MDAHCAGEVGQSNRRCAFTINRKKLPVAFNTFELVVASTFELDTRACHQVNNRARDEEVPGVGG